VTKPMRRLAGLDKEGLILAATALFVDVTKKLDPKSAINYSLALMVSVSMFESNTSSTVHAAQ
jgi:hypothetical protein